MRSEECGEWSEELRNDIQCGIRNAECGIICSAGHHNDVADVNSRTKCNSPFSFLSLTIRVSEFLHGHDSGSFTAQCAPSRTRSVSFTYIYPFRSHREHFSSEGHFSFADGKHFSAFAPLLVRSTHHAACRTITNRIYSTKPKINSTAPAAKGAMDTLPQAPSPFW